jgi:hypothetical protein
MTAMLEMLDILRKMPPEMTIAEFLTQFDSATARANCRFCHRPISRLDAGDPRWFHDDPSRMRGCRAASFDVDRDGWNDSLPREWKATPESLSR